MKINRLQKVFAASGGLVLALLFAAALGQAHYKAELLGPEGHYFNSNAVRIHYTDEGVGAPVLLVHGLAFAANLEWRRSGLIDALLAQHYRVIALDNRGHGRSAKPHDPEAYGAEMAEDLDRLLDHLELPRALVVGYSMGGFITLKFVVTHPERVISAAVCGAGWNEPTPENLAFSEAVAEAFERGEAGPLPQRLGMQARFASFIESLGVRAFLTWFNDPLALAAVARGSRGLGVTDTQLRANTVPVLTVIGENDGLLPEAQALHERMANHQLVILPGKNHMNTDSSKVFRANIEEFLRQYAQAS
ncbi:MAG: alpha/beta fold hydrolase [Candidatus Hydrogenedens sp.]|nr:alpha/beta fold hydrolase [Candidatus Hydrogenedens sp.]